MSDGNFGFTRRDWRRLQALRTPQGIQRMLDSFAYHDADTAWSPLRVLRERQAHCCEGAIFAAAALRAIGKPPLIMDLEGERDDDHVIAVYRQGSCWGAIAKSHFTGLRDRAPVYRTLRELALSYFEDYFNLLGARTLRGYCRPIDLSRFDHLNWMTSQRPVWFIPGCLVDAAHIPLITKGQSKRLYRVDRLAIDAGLHGHAPYEQRRRLQAGKPNSQRRP
jgi:hypothetical protein